MKDFGPATANVNPTMEGVTPGGGDNEDQKPEDPKGPTPLSTMSEEDQQGALAAGSRAASMFPPSVGKSPDETYR